MKYDSSLVESEDNHGMIPLHLACRHGHVKVAQVHEDHSHLRSACEHHDAEGNTPLHLACSGSNVGIVKLLIGSKADAKATNNLSEMPLHIAVDCGHLPIVQFLLKKEVSLEWQTANGHTPLHYAARKNNSEMITQLVERYVLKIFSKIGMQPLAKPTICGIVYSYTRSHAKR